MPCTHLSQLYQLCERHELKLSSSDLIRIVCPECGIQETCPSEHLADHEEGESDSPASESNPVNIQPPA